MAELLRPLLIEDFDGAPLPQEMQPEAESIEVSLYCWPCLTVHTFALADVERIVYALGQMYIDAHGYRDDSVGEHECLLTVLRWGNDFERYAERIAQGVACREAHQ